MEKSRAAQNEKGENLSPTGQSSADTIPAGTDPLLLATARAIRKALDGDPALARADVRVTPEEGKIVLRGRVNDQKTKTAIIEKATSEVKGWKIDDQISIERP
jgi:osmotically-inducible protein OsmY